jgi:hypothetical protein
MLEKDIEKYFVKRVQAVGGKAYKFVSPSNRGVSDRVVCFADGSTHFVELKRPGGKLSPLQQRFASDMREMNQNYACLWSTQDVDEWICDHISILLLISSSPMIGQ